MLDIKKPLQTTSGKPVTIISDQGRSDYGGQTLKLLGYIEDSMELKAWDENGVSPAGPTFDLQYRKEDLFINIYFNGNVGAFRTAEAAMMSPAMSRFKVSYTPGIKEI